MSASRDPEPPVSPPAPPPQGEPARRDLDRAPLHPPATPDPDPGRALTIGPDGVVDEPGDDDRPGFDDDLDPADAP